MPCRHHPVITLRHAICSTSRGSAGRAVLRFLTNHVIEWRLSALAAVVFAGRCFAGRTAAMAIVDQKERYRRQAALCYEIAATMAGERAISMARLGDAYAALATNAGERCN
jgi:hypothetical protein